MLINSDNAVFDIVLYMYSTANAEQTYFAIRSGKAQCVDVEPAVEGASVGGGKSHFAAKLRICPPRQAAVRDMAPSRCAFSNQNLFSMIS
ncbi:hypothetical protein DPMN_060112 [Dreissena polymorpha]|uniref:Uncharacterized protein n=1 Tax=Dreissena polymorpha TaxID=45954 RepID=A0A9D4C5D5_DREPO|nr:hypothetical protein DPMN_060112 [Dreissena polymorpha]